MGAGSAPAVVRSGVMPQSKYINGQATPAVLEELMAETITKVGELHERLDPVQSLDHLKTLLEGLVTSHTVMASSAVLMADTFKRSED